MACFPKKCALVDLLHRNKTLGTVFLNNAVANARSNVKISVARYCLEVPKEQVDNVEEKGKEISKAMENYLKRTREYEEFIQQQIKEFNRGKEFLARIMKKDPNTMDQKTIDESIEYLFPSGLFEKVARPSMKHPELVYKKQKAAQFDTSGRPFHFLFYTAKPNYSSALHDCATYMENLNIKLKKLGLHGVDQKAQIKVTPNWMSKDNFEKLFMEPIMELEYNKLIEALTRLCEHPYSYEYSDFISKFTTTVEILSNATRPKVTNHEVTDGVHVIEVDRCRRKTCGANVTVTYPGTGKISINDMELIDMFEDFQSREIVLFPLIFTNMLGKVDVKAQVDQIGSTAQACAIRLGMSRAIANIVPEDMLLRLKLAGLLVKDPRRRERKKPGREGARRRYTWLKR